MYGNNSKRTFIHDICKLPNHVERGDQPENKGMGGGGGCHVFYYFILYYCVFGESKVPVITF